MQQRLRHYRSPIDLTQCGTTEGDVYRSQWHRGLSEGMEWLRLTLTGVTSALIRIYTSSVPDDNPQKPTLEQRGSDLLLYGVRGKYLSFTVQPRTGLTGYDLSFPGNSIDSGLPWTMQGDEILRRYLGSYQSLYMDLNQEYASQPRRLDPRAPTALPWLERWVGAGAWTPAADDAQKKELIAAAAVLNRERGTRRGLERLVRLATGKQGRLIERYQWEESAVDAAERAACEQLYGTAQAALLLPAGTGEKTVRFLEETVEDFLPAGVDCRIILLEEDAPMDGHCYMDENARLTEARPSCLDGSPLDSMILE